MITFKQYIEGSDQSPADPDQLLNTEINNIDKGKYAYQEKFDSVNIDEVRNHLELLLKAPLNPDGYSKSAIVTLDLGKRTKGMAGGIDGHWGKFKVELKFQSHLSGRLQVGKYTYDGVINGVPLKWSSEHLVTLNSSYRQWAISIVHSGKMPEGPPESTVLPSGNRYTGD